MADAPPVITFNYSDYFILTAIIVSSILLIFFWFQRKYRNAAAWTKVYVAAVMPLNYLLALLLQDSSAAVLDNGVQVRVLRYWGWLATCPVLLLDIFSAMPLRKADQDPVQALAAIILDQLMVVCGVSAIIYGGTAKIVLFCMGCCFGLLVYRLILIAFFKAYSHYPDDAKPWLIATALLFCGGWFLFPIGWVLGTEGFGVIPADISGDFGEAFHACADLIAKCAYSYVGWYTRHVVLARILIAKRAEKEAVAAEAGGDAVADAAGSSGSSRPDGSGAGSKRSGSGALASPAAALKALQMAPGSAQEAILRIAHALRAFGPDSAIVRHAVSGACDAAAAGVAAAAPAIARALLSAARRARQRRVLRFLLVDPDPLVHTAVASRLAALARQDALTGVAAEASVAAQALLLPVRAQAQADPQALLRPAQEGGAGKGGWAAPAAGEAPSLAAVAAAAGLCGIEVEVESVFRLDDVPLVLARGDAHLDGVVVTSATLHVLAQLPAAEARRRGLNVNDTAALKDQLTSLTLARGNAAASLAAAAGASRRMAPPRGARPGAAGEGDPDFQGSLGTGPEGARLMREEARRMQDEEPLGLAIKTRTSEEEEDGAAAPAADTGADEEEEEEEWQEDGGGRDDGAEGLGTSTARQGDDVTTPSNPRQRGIPGQRGPARRRLSLSQVAADTADAADARVAAGAGGLSGGAVPRTESRRTASPATAGLVATQLHPTQRLFGLVPVLVIDTALAGEDRQPGAAEGRTTGPMAASPLPAAPPRSQEQQDAALLRELGGDLLLRGFDSPAQWRRVLQRIGREAAARGQAQVVATPTISSRRLDAPSRDADGFGGGARGGEGGVVASSSRRSRSTGGRRVDARSSSGRAARSQSRSAHRRQSTDVAPASPAAVESMLALLRPSESLAAARRASVRRYLQAVTTLAQAMASGAVRAASRAAARAALAGSLSAGGMAYLYRDREACEAAREAQLEEAGSEGGFEGTAAVLPQLALILDSGPDDASQDGRSQLVTTEAVEWRRHAAQQQQGRVRRRPRSNDRSDRAFDAREARGDGAGHLSLNRAGRIIKRRDSAVLAMHGAFFGNIGQDDGADELWEPTADSPRRSGSPYDHHSGGARYGGSAHTAVPVGRAAVHALYGPPTPHGPVAQYGTPVRYGPVAEYGTPLAHEAVPPYESPQVLGVNPMHSGTTPLVEDGKAPAGRSPPLEGSRGGSRGAGVVHARGLDSYAPPRRAGRRGGGEQRGEDGRQSRSRGGGEQRGDDGRQSRSRARPRERL